jgi:hypothetical protein
LSSKLYSLVEAEDDPEIYLHVLQNLGAGVPLVPRPTGDTAYGLQVLCQKRAQFLLKLLFPSPGPKNDRAERLEMQRRAQQLLILQINELLQQKEVLEALLEKLLHEKSEELQERLKDRNPTIRWLTIQAIGRRRLPLHRELIERLADSVPAVAQAARAALVRLGRGIDFGPKTAATRKQREQAAQRWRQWLALQQTSPGEAAARQAPSDSPEVLPHPAVE